MEVRAVFIVISDLLYFTVDRLCEYGTIIPYAQKRPTVSLLLGAKMRKLCVFAPNSKLAVGRFCALASKLMKISSTFRTLHP